MVLASRGDYQLIINNAVPPDWIPFATCWTAPLPSEQLERKPAMLDHTDVFKTGKFRGKSLIYTMRRWKIATVQLVPTVHSRVHVNWALRIRPIEFAWRSNNAKP
ncbi:MAG: hypothetical protein R3C28_18745 [Pirellulaceae bacterium]